MIKLELVGLALLVFELFTAGVGVAVAVGVSVGVGIPSVRGL